MAQTPLEPWKYIWDRDGLNYRISSVIRRSFFLPKQSQRSRSVLQDGSRSFGLFRKGKIGIIAKFHRTDLVIWSYSRGTKTPSYSRINTVMSINHSILWGGINWVSFPFSLTWRYVVCSHQNLLIEVFLMSPNPTGCFFWNKYIPWNGKRSSVVEVYMQFLFIV